MKNKILKIVLLLSIVLNIILGGILCLKYSYVSQSSIRESEKEYRDIIQKKAELFVRKAVCDNLFYPNTYDPVKTSVDSVFYGPLTDAECVNAAIKLIDLRSQYSITQDAYNEAIDLIKFHGMTDLGTFHWGKDRDNAKSQMKDLWAKIEHQQAIIQNRDTSKDGKYVGWQVVHRYRAANGEGAVSFGNVLYILNPEFTESYFTYSLDENNYNLESIKKVIESELGVIGCYDSNCKFSN